MRTAKTASVLFVYVVAGCERAPAILDDAVTGVPAPVIDVEEAGASRGESGSFAALELRLEPSGGPGGGLPRRLRLLATNAGQLPVRFNAPGPFCPQVTEGDRKIRYPLLGVVFWDAEGREGDSRFGPFLADLEATEAPVAEEVVLAPGGTWSREYPTVAFSFFGPCGPAANVEALFRPGTVELKLSLEILEVRHRDPSDANSAAEGEPVTMVRQRTDPLSVRVRESPLLFRQYSDEYQAERLDDLDAASDEENFPQPEVRAPGVFKLLKSFDASGFDEHVFAARLLLRLGPDAKEAVPKLMDVLARSRLYGDRVLASRVLGSIGPAASAAVPLLTRAEEDSNDHVRQEAAAALARVLGKTTPEPIDRATGERLFQGKPVSYWIQKLLALEEGDDHDDERMRARRALLAIGAPAVPALLGALKSAPMTRFWVVGILRRIDDPAARELLAKALTDGDPRVRRGAAEAFVGEDPSSSGREARFVPLADGAVGALAGALRDADRDVRKLAAQALGRPEAVSAGAALAAALSRDPEKLVRAAAAGSLGELPGGPAVVGSAAVLEALRAAATTDDLASVRHAAIGSLRKLGEKVELEIDPVSQLRERIDRGVEPDVRDVLFASIERAPGDPEGLFFVLAHSGSNAETLPATKQMVARMIEALPATAEFAVVFYSSIVVAYPEDSRPALATGAAKAAGLKFVRETEQGSGSCLQVGFDAVFDRIEAAKAKKIVVVYVGNGLAICPSDDSPVYEAETLESVVRRNRGRAVIHTFGGETCNVPLLRLLAETNGGSFTRLDR